MPPALLAVELLPGLPWSWVPYRAGLAHTLDSERWVQADLIAEAQAATGYRWQITIWAGPLDNCDPDGPLLTHLHSASTTDSLPTVLGDVLDFEAIVSDLTAAVHVARDRVDHQPLRDRVDGLVLDRAGGSFPYQAEGSLAGLPFYFRYRHGHASLRVGHDPVMQGLYQSHATPGDDEAEGDGMLTSPQFHALFIRLIRDLARAPFRWEFAGIDPATGAPATHYAWGQTPQQALADLQVPPEPSWHPSLTAASWARHVAAMALQPEPINSDDRVFPDPEPDFPALILD